VGERIADYDLVSVVGAGERSTVHRAVPPPRLAVDADHVAVKVLQAPSADDARRRLTRELRHFAAVRSPLVVPLLDAGQDGDRFFYAMPWYEDGALTAGTPRARGIAAVASAARAAHELHEAGIVHRAIKPSNILLTATGAVLADLGLAQLLAPGQTTTGIGSAVGVEYLDPKVILGAPASRASDVWSIGITLHRVLAGVGVYGDLPDRDPLLAVRAVLTRPPAPAPSLTAQERAVVEAALAADPDARPPTAAAMADLIDALG
jgi:serine/threonine protein kinase